jgi:hypothetical protein
MATGLINVTTWQRSFLDTVSECGGNIQKAFEKIGPCTMSFKQDMVRDKPFWNAVLALRSSIARASVLNEGFLKDHMVACITGEKKLTSIQVQAINVAIRAIGMGQYRQQGKVTVTPEQIQVEFSDGPVIQAPLNKPSAQAPVENAATGQPDPSIKLLAVDKEQPKP